VRLNDVDVSMLRNDSVEAMPISYDWLEADGEAWQTVGPRPASDESVADIADWCESFGVDLSDVHHDVAAMQAAISEHFVDDGQDSFAPMMSYYYPLPGADCDLGGDVGALQYDLGRDVGTVVVVLMREDADWPDMPVLALAGGGMNLAWEICAGYMLAGYLPPLHFCDLPDMAGWESERWRGVVLAGCARTCDMAAGWAGRRLGRIAEYQTRFEAGASRRPVLS
jgi:hypothetical protein